MMQPGAARIERQQITFPEVIKNQGFAVSRTLGMVEDGNLRIRLYNGDDTVVLSPKHLRLFADLLESK
jgi:hypothetical protein